MATGRRDLQKEITPSYAETVLNGTFGKFIPNPDKTLDSNSREGIGLYNTMLRVDANLAQCFHKRSTNVLSLGFDILPGDNSPRALEIAEFIKDVLSLKEIPNLPASRERMFRGVAMGYAPTEIIFKARPDGKIGIAALKGRNPEYFRFDKDNNLVHISGLGIQGDIMPPEKFILNTWGDDETPYGNGLLREIYPLWFFKANALKALVRYVEKSGTGFLIGQYAKGTQSGEIDNLLDMLKQMQSNNVAAIPEGSSVDFKQADNANVVNLFEYMIDRFVHHGYTLAILGQTTSTESESGTFALGKFQSKGEQRLIEQDAQWHESQMQPMVNFLVDLNFGPQEFYPVFSVPYEENKDVVSMLAGYKAAVEVGIPIQKRWALEQLGFPIPEGIDEAELDGMLEVQQPPSPFGAYPGAGFGEDEEPGDKEEADKANGLSESACRMQLSEKKKTAFAAEWTRLLEELTVTAKGAGWSGYEKYRLNLERQIMQAQSFIEIKTWTQPQAEKYLLKHFQDVLRQAQLTGRALYWQNIARTFADEPSYVSKWLEAHPQAANIPGMLAKLNTDADLSGLGLLTERQAWAFFRNKIPMTRDAFDRLSERAKLKAFTVARLEDKNSIAAIQRGVTEALDKGLSLDDFKGSAAKIFDAAGITPASSYHLDTVYLTNVHTQANAARWNELKNDTSPMRQFIPALRYVTAGDEAVRPEHAALEGVTLNRDDPAWNRIYPPNGFNCVPAGTMVLTADGLKPIEGVMVGEGVITHKGRVRKVIELHRNEGPDELVAVELENGNEARFTDGHRVLTEKGWIKASKLNIGDKVLNISPVLQNRTVSDVDNIREAERADNVPVPCKIGFSGGVSNLKPHIQGGDVKVKPIFSGIVVKNEREAVTVQNIGEQLFKSRHWGACIRMLFRVFPVTLYSGIRYFLSDFRAAKRSAYLKRERGFPGAAWVQNIVKFLGGCPVTGTNAMRLEYAFDGPEINSGLFLDAGNLNRPGGIIRKGLDQSAGVGGFNPGFSAEPVGSASVGLLSHGLNVIESWSKVKRIKRVTRSHKTVYNLGVEQDESYIANGMAVHNCRCQVVEVAAFELENGSERMTQGFSGGKPDDGFDQPPV